MNKAKIINFLKTLYVRKSIEDVLAECDKSKLSKNLGMLDLICIGIGATIGAGIFVLTGMVSADVTGPASCISFIIAAIASMLTAFSYAEMASMIPSSGSAYAYTLSSLGEFTAWIVFWNILLEFIVGSATIASSWSTYLNETLHSIFNVSIPSTISQAPIYFETGSGSFHVGEAYLNIPGIVISLLITAILVIGISESKTANNIIVAIKLITICIFIFGGIKYINHDNYIPFVPERKNGKYGAVGVITGAQRLFMAYIGFDAVSTAAQEAKNPKRDVPIGIIVSLLVCLIVYVSLSVVLTGIAKYNTLSGIAISHIFSELPGGKWLQISVSLGALAGLTSACLVCIMAASRLFMCVANDGLLPGFFMRVHHRFKTPYISTLVVGIMVAIFSGFLPISVLSDMTSSGALVVFCFVNIGVMVLGKVSPEAERPYKVPFGSYILPGVGAVITFSLLLMAENLTRIQMSIWFALGCIVYFISSRRGSRLLHCTKHDSATSE